MRVRTVLVLAAMLLPVAGTHRQAAAAECPAECGSQILEVVCMTVEYTDGDTQRVTRSVYYYGNLPR